MHTLMEEQAAQEKIQQQQEHLVLPSSQTTSLRGAVSVVDEDSKLHHDFRSYKPCAAAFPDFGNKEVEPQTLDETSQLAMEQTVQLPANSPPAPESKTTDLLPMPDGELLHKESVYHIDNSSSSDTGILPGAVVASSPAKFQEKFGALGMESMVYLLQR